MRRNGNYHPLRRMLYCLSVNRLVQMMHRAVFFWPENGKPCYQSLLDSGNFVLYDC